MRGAVVTAAKAMRPVTRRWRARESQELLVLGWHRLGPAASYDDDGLTTPLAGFAAQLDLLAERDMTVLGLDDALARQRAGTLPPRAVVLTFDDGYASVIEQAWPMLRERDWPATLYVVSDTLRGRTDFPWDGGRRDEVVRLSTAADVAAAAAEGLDIGSHTVSHPWMPTLGEAEIVDQATRSKAELEDFLGREVPSFAYPMGGYHPGIVEAARRAGYAHAVTCDRGAATPRHDPLLLRREFAPDTAEELALLLDGATAWLRPLDTLRRRGPEPVEV